MLDFQFYVTDDRYSVPSLMLVQSKDPQSAYALARRMLDEPHYHAIEVWAAERRLFEVSELSTPSAA